MSLPMHEPVIRTDGGPWAEHDQACAVCGERKAVLDLGNGIFDPCWDCQTRGWRLTIRRRWRTPRRGLGRIRLLRDL